MKTINVGKSQSVVCPLMCMIRYCSVCVYTNERVEVAERGMKGLRVHTLIIY